MILLDTHIWFWWVSNRERLRPEHISLLLHGSDHSIAVSIMSCWEVAKLVQCGRLVLDRPVKKWIEEALIESGCELLPLTPTIVVESTQLPEPFHRDPADQILVATARILDCVFLTEDAKVRAYKHVKSA